VVALLAPASGSAVSPLHSISVYGEDESGEPLAIFTKATCKRTTGKSGKGFRAAAVSTDGKSELEVTVPQFGGFKKEYEINLGSKYPEPSVNVDIGAGRSGTLYGSFYEPPYPVPAIGRILFREGGRLMGVGFGPSLYEKNGERAVDFTGVVECEKPKKGKKRK
jgi:hypothetical protein